MNKQALPVALVTGAARRIGAVLVEHLHQAGFSVIVHSHLSKTAAEKLVAELNQKRSHSAVMLSADFCDPISPQLLIQQSVKQWGRLDLLVHNASIFSREDNDSNRMWQCNVHAPYALNRAVYPHLKATHGSIVNITDIHAHRPLRDYPVYCQTKAALAMQTQIFAQEFAPEIRVNAIAPGAIAWPEHDNQLSSARKEKILAETLVKRHGKPEHIAQALLYLVHNDYVTGQSLVVDGGRSLTKCS